MRSVASLHKSYPAEPAPGLHVMRPLPGPGVEQVDPFLMLDHFGPLAVAPGGNGGLNPHPHRGFETVTILFQGAMEHHDSAGNRGVLRPGDVQWMTAAGGIVHAEYHEHEFARQGGTLEGVQLWVNLPRRRKMDPPGYQDLPSARIPVVEVERGRIRVIAGQVGETGGAARTHTPISVLHLALQAGGRAAVALPSHHNAAVYVVRGGARTGAAVDLAWRDMAVFAHNADEVVIEAVSDSDLLLLAGEPIDEPVVSYGPFVMNTREEIFQAIQDFQGGKMGRL